jgi:formamidopyrimidine-DNA glycosylase
MPELPDITIYIEALSARTLGEPLEAVRIASPFVLRSYDPPIDAVCGMRVREIRRLGKRIVFALGPREPQERQDPQEQNEQNEQQESHEPQDQQDLFLVIHLMIAGRLHWKPPRAGLSGKIALAAFDFPRGTLVLTEAAKMKRASIQVVRDDRALAALDPGGIDPLTCDPDEFADALTAENHTLKRSLTDPRLFSGIGNAYSDEILHAAGLSPVLLTRRIPPAAIERLHRAVRDTMIAWIERLRAETKDGFPEKITAFRPEMAVHGRAGKPCPTCGAMVQRIVYAENETNYCPRCQTGGRILADRALSRLLKGDWPRSIEELEDSGIPAPKGTPAERARRRPNPR